MKSVNSEDGKPTFGSWSYKHCRISASTERNMIRYWCNSRRMRERAEGFAVVWLGSPWVIWPIYYNHLSWHDTNTKASSINIQSQVFQRHLPFNSSPLMTMNKLSVKVDKFCLGITFSSLLYCYNIPCLRQLQVAFSAFMMDQLAKDSLINNMQSLWVQWLCVCVLIQMNVFQFSVREDFLGFVD